jgi:hypothetical protein
MTAQPSGRAKFGWVKFRRRWRGFARFWNAHPALPLGTAAVGVALLVAAVKFGPRGPDSTNPGQTEIVGWGELALILGAPMAIVGLISSLLRFGPAETRADRIKRLTAALQESMTIIAQINSEIEEGAQRLSELEEQTAVQQELAKLTQQEAAAVREALKGELGRERRRSLVRDVVLLLLGAVLTYLLTRL